MDDAVRATRRIRPAEAEVRNRHTQRLSAADACRTHPSGGYEGAIEDDGHGQGQDIPGAARGAQRVRHPQPMGHRHRQAAGVAGLQGARHHQRRLCLLARPAGRRGRLRDDDPPLPRIGRGDRPAGFGRSGKRQGRQPRKCGRDDLRRRSRRARRLLDRGPHRRSRKTRSTISISPSSAWRRPPTPRAR